MFVQVIQGPLSHVKGLEEQMDRWLSEVAPGAVGWLGTTAGVTDDGTFLALVRFASEEEARRNSDRPDQDRWWAATSKLFGGDVTFHDCREVDTWLAGGSDDAGFVQVIQGRSRDADRLRELTEAFTPQMVSFRPDVIGGVLAQHGDGTFTEAVYFTSEEAARAGERQETPPELEEVTREMATLQEDLRYFDLRKPWLVSPPA